MKTFKQFLESADPLKDLEIEMFFRKELGFTKDHAKVAGEWMQGDISSADMHSDIWDNVVEYVGDVTDRRLFAMNSHDIENFAFEKIAMQMLNKYGIEL